MIFDTFIAANTAKGFFSYFDELLYSNDVKKVFLIKGGPGCGKSTFMKKIANACLKDGLTVEQILCSSDRNSLDGIKIHQKGIVIIDATPPHAYDMKWPGAYENILDFGKFWDSNILKENFDDIQGLGKEISVGYRKVYNLLKAAASIEQTRSIISEQYIDNEKITKCIKKITKQNAILPTSNECGCATNRMLSAFCPDGVFTISETAEKFCDEFIVIDDSIGLGYMFLNKAANAFGKLGYDIIKIHSPLLPESRLEQLFIPSVKLGFVTAKGMFSPQVSEHKVIKKINFKNFLKKEFYAENKNKFVFEKKLIKELIGGVSDELAKIKTLHDNLEGHYIKAIDHNKINDFTTAFINKI